MDPEAGVTQSVLKALKNYPRGLTVSDIAKELGINRNSMARHLGVLHAEGQVDVRTIGTAKVYSVARRVPLSAFLCFTKNMIVILDAALTVVQVNDQYVRLAGISKQDLLGKSLTAGILPVISAPDALAVIRATGKEQTITDIRHHRGYREFFYQMEVIPTTFESGERGLTVVLEDITERKTYMRNMEFLARTAMELVDMPPDTDIFQYIAERIAELVPAGRIYVENYDEVSRQFSMRAIENQDFRNGILQILGKDAVGMTLPIGDVFAAPYFETLESIKRTREHIFRPAEEAGTWSLYDLCMRQIPREICEKVLTHFDIGKLYVTGLVWEDQLFGVAGIFMAPGETLEYRGVVESFLRQASLAIARQQMAGRLHRSEKRFREVMDLSPFPSALIDGEGRYISINRKFTDVFGYTIEDIPTGKIWFPQAFPDPGMRKEAITAWKDDPGRVQEGPMTPRTFDVRCKDGTMKTILFRPVTLHDGSHFVTCEDLTIH